MCIGELVCTAGVLTRESCTVKHFWHDNNIENRVAKTKDVYGVLFAYIRNACQNCTTLRGYKLTPCHSKACFDKPVYSSSENKSPSLCDIRTEKPQLLVVNEKFTQKRLLSLVISEKIYTV